MDLSSVYNDTFSLKMRTRRSYLRSFQHLHVDAASNCRLFNDGLGGRAIAQAVKRRLPTAAARVQNRVWSCGIL
jgi:hypothetical protein